MSHAHHPDPQATGVATALPSPRMLVFGASGYIGTHLVPRLLAAGIPVRAAARSPAVLEARG
jgi:NAD(P)-dependent dehydrogenase (short-subunit alcohol dehydrogenase family)